MRNLGLVVLPIVALVSCTVEPTPEEQRRADEADIAAVESLQEPPVLPISPEPILYPDIEKHNLYGASCAFAPDGGGMGAIALAMADAGYMKIDGSIQRFAPDPGSDEQPLRTRVEYDGKSYSFALKLAERDGKSSGYETTDYGATLIVRNSSDEVVYEAQGTAQCGS